MTGQYVCTARRLAILGALIIVGATQSIAHAADRPPRNIFGTYGRSAASQDSMRVEEKAKGVIGVAIRLYFSNGHSCQLDRDGVWRDDHIAIVTDGLNPTRPCKLNVFFEKDRVLLKDDGLQCALVYCGTRGKLDGASLSKSSVKR